MILIEKFAANAFAVSLRAKITAYLLYRYSNLHTVPTLSG